MTEGLRPHECVDMHCPIYTTDHDYGDLGCRHPKGTINEPDPDSGD